MEFYLFLVKQCTFEINVYIKNIIKHMFSKIKKNKFNLTITLCKLIINK